MELLTPSLGLIFWQTLVFLLLFAILRSFAWKPILNALRIREESIEEALAAAEEARDEMANLKVGNEKLLDEARHERESILKEARQAATSLRDEAKNEAVKATDKMIAEARVAIETEKKAAISEVKSLVAEFSLVIAEKIIRQKLGDEKDQKKIIDKYLQDIKLN
ncbi:MAG: F0F1 ATP synthase subunit B [Cyclobacteriaceae bacterium]|nr:F0F1 ATP synthase subunit B [Cyclobacteriaceae bacterium]